VNKDSSEFLLGLDLSILLFILCLSTRAGSPLFIAESKLHAERDSGISPLPFSRLSSVPWRLWRSFLLLSVSCVVRFPRIFARASVPPSLQLRELFWLGRFSCRSFHFWCDEACGSLSSSKSSSIYSPSCRLTSFADQWDPFPLTAKISPRRPLHSSVSTHHLPPPLSFPNKGDLSRLFGSSLFSYTTRYKPQR